MASALPEAENNLTSGKVGVQWYPTLRKPMNFDDLFAVAALGQAVEAAANAADAFEATEAVLEVGNKLSLAKPLVKPLFEPLLDQLGS